MEEAAARLNKIEQILTSDYCLQCRGCCRFNDTTWLPHFLSFERNQAGFDQITAEPEPDKLRCSFLNAADHTCRIYAQRPFECRLYPFLLVRRERSLDLAVHLACPFVTQHAHTRPFKEFSAYVSALLAAEEVQRLLQPEMVTFHSYPQVEMNIITRDIVTEDTDTP